MLEVLDYSNLVKTRNSVKRLDDAKIQLKKLISKNKKIMLRESWTK